VKGLCNAADKFIAEEIPETAARDITTGVTASQETTVTESTTEEPVVSSAVPISGQSRVEVRRSARERTQPKRFDGFDVQLPPSTVPAQPALPSADSSCAMFLLDGAKTKEKTKNYVHTYSLRSQSKFLVFL
ncbi:pleiotropic regulator 1, partial [Corchorus capsularis]